MICGISIVATTGITSIGSRSRWPRNTCRSRSPSQCGMDISWSGGHAVRRAERRRAELELLDGVVVDRRERPSPQALHGIARHPPGRLPVRVAFDPFLVRPDPGGVERGGIRERDVPVGPMDHQGPRGHGVELRERRVRRVVPAGLVEAEHHDGPLPFGRARRARSTTAPLPSRPTPRRGSRAPSRSG